MELERNWIFVEMTLTFKTVSYWVDPLKRDHSTTWIGPHFH